MFLREMANAFTFKLVKEDRLDGHEVHVLEAAPRPGYRPRNDKAKVLTGMRGKLWLDKAQGQWVRAEVEVFKPVSYHGFLGRVERGTRIEFEQALVAQGVWMPKHLKTKVDARILLIKGQNYQEDTTYSNYRRDPTGHAQANPRAGK